jgi:hypothetical protein
MTRFTWWLVDLVSRPLEPDERDAVRGDFEESGETAGRALVGALGLLLRRQAAPWHNWSSWCALIGFVLPVGLLLALASSWLGRAYDLNLWIFRNSRDLDPTVLADTGLTVRHGVVLLVSRSLLLACWSWASGFVMGSLSRRTMMVNGALLGGLLLLTGLAGRLVPYQYDVSGGWFPLTFYTVLFPLMRNTTFVLLPLLGGMHQGGGRVRSALVQTIAWATAIVTALAARRGFWFPFRAGWPIELLLPAVYMPIVYMLATAVWQRWRERVAAE